MCEDYNSYIASCEIIEQELEKMTVHNQKIHSGIIQRIVLLERRIENIELLYNGVRK